ncbi:hypothetical protein HDU86_006768 [Geranomyces michiganensis]|nr:hypothetical protein HDU86_006768 [Geranomyces michiganensis]
MAAIHTITLGTTIIDYHVMRIFLPPYEPRPPLPEAIPCEFHLVASKTNQALPALLIFLHYLPQVRVTSECISEFAAKGCGSDLGKCVACATDLPKGYLVVQRDVTPVEKDGSSDAVETTDDAAAAAASSSANTKQHLDGLAFRLSPRVLCGVCLIQLLATTKEIRQPTEANNLPLRPVRMAWSDPPTQSLVRSYAEWFFAEMGEMSQKRVRPLHSSSRAGGSGGEQDNNIDAFGLTISFGLSQAMQVEMQSLLRKDWVIHRGSCHDRERGASEEADAEAQPQSGDFEPPAADFTENAGLADLENDDHEALQAGEDADPDGAGPPLAAI